MKNLHVSALLDVYGDFLSEKQKNITEHYFNEDLSLSEIAENEGITRQAVSDLIKRTESQLKAFEEKCGYCEKFARLKELVANKNNGEWEELVNIIENL